MEGVELASRCVLCPSQVEDDAGTKRGEDPTHLLGVRDVHRVDVMCDDIEAPPLECRHECAADRTGRARDDNHAAGSMSSASIAARSSFVMPKNGENCPL